MNHSDAIVSNQLKWNFWIAFDVPPSFQWEESRKSFWKIDKKHTNPKWTQPNSIVIDDI